MEYRHRGANEKMRNALARVAPGTPLRDGIDRVVRAQAGALLVLSDEPDVLSICSGGFLVDAPYSPQRLSELAKMDGAIIISTEGGRIARANVHLVPDPTVPTSETGTRHRTAERGPRRRRGRGQRGLMLEGHGRRGARTSRGARPRGRPATVGRCARRNDSRGRDRGRGRGRGGPGGGARGGGLGHPHGQPQENVLARRDDIATILWCACRAYVGTSTENMGHFVPSIPGVNLLVKNRLALQWWEIKHTSRIGGTKCPMFSLDYSPYTGFHRKYSPNSGLCTLVRESGELSTPY